MSRNGSTSSLDSKTSVVEDQRTQSVFRCNELLIALGSIFTFVKLPFSLAITVLSDRYILNFLSFSSLAFHLYLLMKILSGASPLSASGGLRYAPFGMRLYLQNYKEYLDAELFGTMTLNGDVKTVYDARNGFNRDMALGALVSYCAHWSRGGAVLQSKQDSL